MEAPVQVIYKENKRGTAQNNNNNNSNITGSIPFSYTKTEIETMKKET